MYREGLDGQVNLKSSDLRRAMARAKAECYGQDVWLGIERSL
ncbi:MAG: hypothetical protein ACI91Z_000066 [Yoonia sp.]|jgi:hypothetical protein